MTTKRSTKSKRNKSLLSKEIIDPAVQIELTTLNHLKNSRQELQLAISNIVNAYNAQTTLTVDASKFLEKLPLDSLRELQDFSNGKKIPLNLEILKSRSALKKEHHQKIQFLIKIEQQIADQQITLLLLKIERALVVKNEI